MKRLGVIAASLTIAGLALAAAPEPVSADDRFIVSTIDGGILRVDRETGHVSVCRESGGDWSCQLVPDDRDAMEYEIRELQASNRRLRRQLSRYDSDAANRAYGQADRQYDDLGEGGLMTKKEVDEAMDTMEYMMDRFLGATERLRDRAGQ